MGINIYEVFKSYKKIFEITEVLFEMVKDGKEDTLLPFVIRYNELTIDFGQYLLENYGKEADFENMIKKLKEKDETDNNR